MKPSCIRASLVLTALVVVVSSLPPSEDARAERPRIVNGLNSHDFSTTGALLYAGATPINENNADSSCSGTLIGCQTFLTAAHCVEEDFDPSHYWVYLQHAGIQTVTSITAHPSYTSWGFPGFDVAVLKLGSIVMGIDPTPVNTAESPPFDTRGTIVGFGQTSGDAGDYGIKRVGRVETSDCTGVLPELGNSELVCWHFYNPVGPPGDDSNTCNGDSGGPLFVDIGAGEAVAGVTSGGTGGDCLASDESYDSNVFTYRSFILDELGTDSTTTCGGIPPVGDPGVKVIGSDGSLSSANPSTSFEVPVPANSQALRFTLNGENNGSFDVDFYVKEGAGASPSDFDCKADGQSNVGACTFISPSGGDWSVRVERASGSGEYQVTTTVFGGDPPVCGNNVAELGEDCDGTDDRACPGLCQLDCTCPPPDCGNNVVEQGEECDGTDDSACSGSCQPDCSCPAACNTGDLFVWRAKVSRKRFVFTMELENDRGIYDGLDPRQQYTLEVTQGLNSASVNIPPLDAGWARSKPERGRYSWKGELNGIRRVKALDNSLRKGIWKLKVRGVEVPGAAAIDLLNPTLIDVRLTMDGTCTETSF
jgi:hypothetical protein